MKKFGVIGNPIQHSLSPIIHNFLFSYMGIGAEYQKIHLLNSQELRQTLLSLKGANITLPYKEDALKICDEIEGIAQEIGAVNAILHNDSKLLGFNTDALGFWECIKNKTIDNALILGAGGSAKAIAVILRQKGIEVSIYNRNPQRLQSFSQMGFKVQSMIELRNYDLLINATSAGMDRVSLPLQDSILKDLVQKSEIIFDVIYPQNLQIKDIKDFKAFLLSSEETAFTHFAKMYKKEAYNGVQMLLYQALFAFEIFCKRKYLFEELKGLFYNS